MEEKIQTLIDKWQSEQNEAELLVKFHVEKIPICRCSKTSNKSSLVRSLHSWFKGTIGQMKTEHYLTIATIILMIVLASLDGFKNYKPTKQPIDSLAVDSIR